MRFRVRDTGALAAASVMSGLLAYAFFAVATRALGASAAAPISVLWTAWTFTAAALTFPIQHWITRTVAASASGRSEVATVLPHVGRVVIAVGALLAIGSAVVRDDVFRSDSFVYPLLLAGVTIGSGFIGWVRGSLAGERRFLALSGTLITENGVRAAGAVVLSLADVRSPLAYGLCLVAGSFAGGLWPGALRGTGRGATSTSSASPLRFLAGSSVGQLLSQVVLTSGPLVLALLGGPAAAVTSLFAALAVFRAPYLVAVALVATLTGRLTTLHVTSDISALRRARWLVVSGTALLVPMAALSGAALGPWLLPLIFGPTVSLDRPTYALLAAGSTLALANLVLTIMLLAAARSTAVAWSWGAAVLAGAAVLLVGVGSADLAYTAWAFVLAEAVAWAALVMFELTTSQAGKRG